ncbi:hypothetical protein CY35_14G106900 [Sphagnum magellanicum]|nr:hypothetical protein CY35_14G106900 [Sphagnum magellanicum]
MTPYTKQDMMKTSNHYTYHQNQIDLYWDIVVKYVDENDKLKKNIDNLNERLQKVLTEHFMCRDENEKLKKEFGNLKEKLQKKEIEYLREKLQEKKIENLRQQLQFLRK